VSLSVIVITKNEERNIAACLDSVRWADEILIVDACSEDHTVDIARRYTDRVLVKPWAGYGPQKNFAIDQATSDWILILDADERVPDALKSEVLAVIRPTAAGGPVGYEIPRKNFFYGAWVKGGGLYPDYQQRLFRRGAGRYDDTMVHERLELRGEVRRLKAPMDHLSMPTIGHHVRKIRNYTTLAAREKLKRTSRVTGIRIATHHLGTICKSYFLRKGYRDGVRGLVVCLFAGMYTFVKYAKAWEAQAGHMRAADETKL